MSAASGNPWKESSFGLLMEPSIMFCREDSILWIRRSGWSSDTYSSGTGDSSCHIGSLSGIFIISISLCTYRTRSMLSPGTGWPPSSMSFIYPSAPYCPAPRGSVIGISSIFSRLSSSGYTSYYYWS